MTQAHKSHAQVESNTGQQSVKSRAEVHCQAPRGKQNFRSGISKPQFLHESPWMWGASLCFLLCSGRRSRTFKSEALLKMFCLKLKIIKTFKLVKVNISRCLLLTAASFFWTLLKSFCHADSPVHTDSPLCAWVRNNFDLWSGCVKLTQMARGAPGCVKGAHGYCYPLIMYSYWNLHIGSWPQGQAYQNT